MDIETERKKYKYHNTELKILQQTTQDKDN